MNEIELPEGAEYVGAEQSDVDPFPFNMADVARIVGHHRVTILRMEQRNVIPKAKWRKMPQPHRVYSKEDIEKIREILDARHPANRDYVADVIEETTEVTK